mmetsp:Transcript_17796/g.38506  ORF Transcript_17796/g.38506 Transcript_17796/m.38506 type:complete len:252 (-) Transcript_17796:169-924(-)|eukprot:CAMPEP_0172530582 /NCGR_PEP_ID=MMETSP1067-20121228/4276_1 /TAXON_ID=265564 ORGANISM="Thalassiosira punctigera, Strain Tpunct2005C2" /NCGR_SAMPLE_ID=MMETSP1067 /ASSEMBLY_ACC=CAM_ASM_000444 /LENGTH=251 /DNA_ID=CAMNT_0013314823 /DNA_START=132 /DNA_END=887 /DNA_ORIENTATION=+
MTSSPEPSAAGPSSSSGTMDPTALINAYLASPPQPQAPPPEPTAPEHEQVESLRLVKPLNFRSRFWVHFHKYDLEYHPDKKNFARCDLCGRDISVKQGTGGLKNHLKFKHPGENAALLEEDEVPHATVVSTAAISVKHEGHFVKAEASPGEVDAAVASARKRARHDNAYADITIRMEAEKRTNEKHWMEMWTITRRELRVLRQELKEEREENAIRDLEGDVRVMEKKKSDYAELLGFPREDGNADTSTEDI